MIVMVNRGYGRSSTSAEPITYDLMASDVIAVIDAARARKVSVVVLRDGAFSASFSPFAIRTA